MTTFTFVAGAGVVFLLLTFLIILDIASKDFGSLRIKLIWGVVVALVPFIGCIIYLLFGFRMGKRPINLEESVK